MQIGTLCCLNHWLSFWDIALNSLIITLPPESTVDGAKGFKKIAIAARKSSKGMNDSLWYKELLPYKRSGDKGTNFNVIKGVLGDFLLTQQFH